MLGSNYRYRYIASTQYGTSTLYLITIHAVAIFLRLSTSICYPEGHSLNQIHALITALWITNSHQKALCWYIVLDIRDYRYSTGTARWRHPAVHAKRRKLFLGTSSSGQMAPHLVRRSL